MNGKQGIFLALAASTALVLGWFYGGRGVAAELVYPIERVAHWTLRHVGSRLGGLWNAQRAAAENLTLRREVEALRLGRDEGDRLAAENDRLRAALAYPPRAKARWIPAPVFSRGGTTGDAGLLRVGKGALDGVTKNSPVAVADGLVGRVVAVSPHVCEVRLLSDPAERVACEVETLDPAAGVVRGILSGGGRSSASGEGEATLRYAVDALRLRHLGRDVNLPPRARIITSGLGGVYPRGLTVGFLIDGTREDETKLEREGEVVPAVDFAVLEDVFIRREE